MVILTGFLLGGASNVTHAEDETPRVVLPKMDVNAPVVKELEKWRYAGVAEWEVYSQVADRKSRGLLESLQKFDFALRIIQPRLVAEPASALTIVFVDDARYRSLLGLPPGQPVEFSTLRRREGRAAIVVNTAVEFDLPDDVPVGPNTIDPQRLLDRQYLRHVLAAQGAPLPAWLEEGLAQALADVEYSGDWIAYGKVNTEQNMPRGEQPDPVVIPDYLAPNRALTGLSFKQLFTHRSLMPLEDFFTARREDGSPPSPDSAWAKQAYALVHFCLFGNKLRYQQPLTTLATRLKTEPMSEALFKECFGISYAKMEKELRGYLYHTRFKYQRYPLKPEQRLKLDPIDFRAATEAEVVWLTGLAL
jgi:hypothetical protein